MHENIVVYSKNDRLCTKEMNDKKNDDVAWVFVLHRNLSLPLNIKILLIAGSLLLFFCYTMWPFLPVIYLMFKHVSWIFQTILNKYVKYWNITYIKLTCFHSIPIFVTFDISFYTFNFLPYCYLT